MNSPISIAWKNLSVQKTDFLDLKHLGRRQKVLRDLHGSFSCNSLNALAGQSGSGKTTLLKALSGANTNGLSFQTEILLRPSTQPPVSYFIEQHIIQTIHGELTVEEVFTYAYHFKNGLGSQRQIGEQIDSVTGRLLLKAEVLSRQFRHLSGGEMKRVVIGQELMGLQAPDFIFCDEPVSGLDSYAALEVVRCLASLVQSSSFSSSSQLTIVISIHAPSNELLEYFSKLYVLAKGGVAVYSGPPDHLATTLSQTLPNYEERWSKEQPLETLISIADDSVHQIGSTTAISELIRQTSENELFRIQSQASSLEKQSPSLSGSHKTYSVGDQFTLLRRQLRLTFIRQFRSNLSLLAFLIAGFVMVSVFYNDDMTTRSDCQRPNETFSSFSGTIRSRENFNYLYFTRTFAGFAFSLLGAITFHAQLGVFRSEHRNRWYSSTVFFLSTSVASTLKLTALSVVITSVMYFVVGEQAIDGNRINWHRFLFYHLLIWLKLLYGTSLGEVSAVLSPGKRRPELAIGLTTVIFACHMLWDDSMIKVDDARFSAVIRISIDLLGCQKYFVKYLAYLFYGLNRCDYGEGEYSLLLHELGVIPDEANYYLFRIVLYIAHLKVVTYLVLLIKFSSFQLGRFLSRSPIRCGILSEQEDVELVKRSSDQMVIELSNNNNNDKAISNHSLTKSSTVFEQRKSVPSDALLAFTNLTLHSKKSLLTSPFIGQKQHQHNSVPILQNLSGQFNFGTLNAIMGMSGAGKTSLLNVLTGQFASQLSPESTFHLNRKAPLRKVFIAQHVTDHLFLRLTAKQALVFASRLKNANDKKVSRIDHEAAALKLLDELAMPEVADRRVERLSGGEQKRLVIALELTSLVMPNLLCVDEPTSGLDSSTAEKVVTILKSFAEAHNICIITSIHQPNCRLLNAFHTLYILSIGGVCIYSGSPHGVRDRFQWAGIPVGRYPIETAIKVSCAKTSDPTVQKLSERSTLCKNKLASAYYSTAKLPSNRCRFSLASTWILFQRQLTFIRSEQWLELLLILLFAIIYGTTIRSFFPLEHLQAPVCISIEADFNSEDTFRRHITPMLTAIRYIALVGPFFFSHLGPLLSAGPLYREFPLFTTEHRNGWYSTGAFLLVKSTVELVLPLIPLLALYAYIVDPFRGGVGGDHYHRNFFFFYPHLLLNLVLSTLANQASVYVLYLLCRQRLPLTIISLTVLNFLNLLLCNLFIPLQGSEGLLQALSQGATARHSVEAFFLRLYGFGRCTEREVQPVLAYMGLADDDYPLLLLKLLLCVLFWKALLLWLLVRRVRQ